MRRIRRNSFLGRGLVALVAGALVLGGVMVPAGADAAPSGNPVGYLDSVARVTGGVRVTGWALDPDTAASIEVHIYADGNGVSLGAASLPRADVARSYPGYGEAHGFDAVVASGSQVCAYGINQGYGTNVLLGCLQVPSGPFGHLDAVSREADGLHARGWAIDPDTEAAIDVHLYVDDRLGASGRASIVRRDVATNVPGYGPAHGFDVIVPDGSMLCAYGINVGAGVNSLLGCAQAPPPMVAAPPAGSSASGIDAMVGDLMTRINDERAARGLGALAWDEELAAGARSWAAGMSRSGMAHSPGAGRSYGENVQSLSWATSGALHLTWMKSAPHRDNIVWPAYGSVGVGIYCAPDGVVWAVERFARIDPAKQTPMGSSPTPLVHGDEGGPAC